MKISKVSNIAAALIVAGLSSVVAAVPAIPTDDLWLQFPDEHLTEMSAYETQLPDTAWNFIPRRERELLISYLENPDSVSIARANALLHIQKSNLYTADPGLSGEALVDSLDHSIYALYFLSRSRSLGAEDIWIREARDRIQHQLDTWLPSSSVIDTEEGRDAHGSFFEAFNYKESDRYKSERLLTLDVLAKPDNITSNLYLAAINQWIGGESDYHDPGTLYAFLKASYFAKRTTLMAQQHEANWEANPQSTSLYRLAPAVGGFSVPTRRWIAKFHGDMDAVASLDREVGEWFAMYPQFYLFPASIFAFNEPENFERGYQYFLDGQAACFENNNIFCEDHPRATYNIISFATLGFDYMIKAGDLDSAMGYLTYKYVPFFNYEKWNMGHDMWRHREDNASDIYALYNDGDVDNDPVNGFLKRHKWGPETSTCQLCHQVQGASWTDAEKAEVKSLPHDQLYVEHWPDFQVDWQGRMQAPLVSCTENADWSGEQTYKKDSEVVLENLLYRAKWWTQEKPQAEPEQWDEWSLIGRCE
ncbi:hypothetical protein [Microbulbifer aggregans]|uniref:hypothetical protein n=1 Tax=Microbulbifer aggregans TaxID=1769779 RepID=UPI001CFCC20F|nr:hypothetical protein [Microbulbifer aggregans]